MLVGRLLFTSVVALALAGCASESHVASLSQPSPAPTTSALSGSSTGPVFSQATTPSDPAAATACTDALGEGVVSAVATTVAEVRAWGTGPLAINSPAADAFPGESGDAFAAWCWVGSDGRFESWGVDGRGTTVDFGTVIHTPADSNTPSGPIGIGK